ncbi:EAL domain-containing protein [Vibrio sp. S4M6]|uniref:two-component system response regulator n=1 Tax=Vibrio sinus TaxID=2946865 RepID=UPI00202A555C|nr:GGDEF domain-containing response regulator [Vibrio sinus]MCL9783328.1 EAL domain-containing protein [Vibrio sinus]
MLGENTQEAGTHQAQRMFLMAEDNPADAEIFTEMIHQAFNGQCATVCVDRFDKISQVLGEHDVQALILDMDLPDRSGVDNIIQLREQYPTLPIVVLTGNEDLNTAIHSLQHGAQDYLTKKQVTPDILERSLHYAKERKNIERKLQDALNDAAEKNVELDTQAKHDSLTGLPNRAYFHDVAPRILHRAQRHDKKVGLLYFDLNGFKKVNDTYGHLTGDKLLQQVVDRISQVVRDSDFFARLGGDEFVLITDVIDEKEEVTPLIQRITQQFKSPFEIGLHKIIISASVGISFYPDETNLDRLLKQADKAMYEAKKHRHSLTCYYADKLSSELSYTQKVESCLSNAFEDNELTARFQPVINRRDSSKIYLEALVRWYSKELGVVSPGDFIPVAENTPAINDITLAVLAYVRALFSSAETRGLKVEKVAINVSAAQLADDQFCTLFLKWLKELNLPTHCICLELTERQIVQNIQKCKEQFVYLRNHGIQISLDDFGTGFSSITHLLELPFDTLKLDRVLISHIDSNTRNQALVAGIVEMAHRLDMTVVAEGIERQEERDKAIELGCDFVQGYLISQAMPVHETISFYQWK